MKLRKETSIHNAFTVDSIITVYYLDWEKAMANSHSNHNVSYNFWQLLYVDRGEYTCRIGETFYSLSSGQMILAEPDKVRTSLSCNNAMIAIISFRCISEGMGSIKNKAITLSDDDRKLISRIFTTGTEIFKTVPENPQYDGQQPKDGTADYELQIIKNSLELLLINLYEPYRKEIKCSPSAQNQINYYEQKFFLIEKYMLENLDKSITIHELSKATGFSQALSSVFSAVRQNAVRYIILSS